MNQDEFGLSQSTPCRLALVNHVRAQLMNHLADGLQGRLV